MRYEPIIPPGMHLGADRQNPGGFRGILFDAAGNLHGPVRMRGVDDAPAGGPGGLNDLQREIAQQLIAYVLPYAVQGVQIAVVKGTPIIARWVRESLIPAVRSTAAQIGTKARQLPQLIGKHSADEDEVLVLHEIVDDEDTVFFEAGAHRIAVTAPTKKVTSDEVAAGLRGAFQEAGVSAKQVEAFVAESATTGTDLVRRESEELTAWEVIDRLAAAISAHPEILDDPAVRGLLERVQLPTQRRSRRQAKD